MTLVEASDQITPILKSGLLGTNKELDEAMGVVDGYLDGYELKGPFQLNQLEILSDEIEKAMKKLLSCYDGLIKGN